mgnify:CR=1 FL=1
MKTGDWARVAEFYAARARGGVALMVTGGKVGQILGHKRAFVFGASIYGPIGIVISQVFYCFPHALMILIAANTHI